MPEFTTADRIAADVGGGLVLLGVVLLGLLEMLLGAGHPVDAEGQIVHEALFPLEVRSSIILLGLAIWALYGVYRLVATTPGRRV